MLRSFGHRAATCCDTLGGVGSNLTILAHFLRHDTMNEYRGDRNVSRKLSTVGGNDNFRRLPSPLVNRKLTLINLKYTCARFNCFYRLTNKQITSNRNFGISKVCNMDQEAAILKPRGTQDDRFFDTFDCTRQDMKDEDRGSHIGRAPVCLFFALVSNHLIL